MNTKKLSSALPGSSPRARRSSLAILTIASLVGLTLPGSLSAAVPRPRLRPLPRPIPTVVHRLPPRVQRVLPPHMVHPIVVPRRAPRLLIPPRPVVVVHQRPRVIRTVPSSQVVVAVQDLAVVPAREFAPAEAYQVVRVDERFLITLLINGAETPVRLLGVDPPAVTASEGMPKPPDAAVHFIENLLLGEFVYLDHDPNLAERDQEGNLVAYLFRAPDKMLVNLELIRQGYALVSEGYEFGYQKEFISYQRKAQADRKGIWALVAETES